MNNLKRIEELRILEEEKINLERKLSNVNKQIDTIQSECSHVGVILDFDTTTCVVCKDNIDSDKFLELNNQGLIINANDYLSEVKDSQERLDMIQTMYLGLCRQYDYKTDAEIVEIFNQIIHDVVSSKKDNTVKQDPKALKRT